MDCSKVLHLEDLPVEILIEIFDYFTANEIYLLFSQLNTRLNMILKSLPNVILMSKNHLDSILTFFHSFKAIHIPNMNRDVFCGVKLRYVNNGHRLLHIYPSFDHYLYSEPFNKLEDIIRPNICSQLRSLSVPNSSVKLIKLIFNGEFPRLEICHLGECERFVLSFSSTIQLVNVRQLSIRNQNGSNFEKILSIFPSLVFLDFCCKDAIPSFTSTTRCLPSMKYLRITRLRNFLFHNGQFDFLLSLFPNLRQFHLTVNQCRLNIEILQMEQIAIYLRHRLPCLKILHLHIYMTELGRLSHQEIHPKILFQINPLFKYLSVFRTLLMINSYGYLPRYLYTRGFARPIG